MHYGLFTYVHGVFVFALFLHQDLTVATLQENLGNAGMGLALLGLMISHGVDFLGDLRSGRLANANPGRVMSEPYHRIVVLHLVVMGSGLLLEFLPYPVVGLVLLTLIKSGMDIFTYPIFVTLSHTPLCINGLFSKNRRVALQGDHFVKTGLSG